MNHTHTPTAPIPADDLPRPDPVPITPEMIEELIYQDRVYSGDWALLAVPGQGLRVQPLSAADDLSDVVLYASAVDLPDPLEQDISAQQYTRAAAQAQAAGTRAAQVLARFAADQDLRTHPEAAQAYRKARPVVEHHRSTGGGWELSHARGGVYLAATGPAEVGLIPAERYMSYDLAAVQDDLAEVGLIPAEGEISADRVITLKILLPRYPALRLDPKFNDVGWLEKATACIREHAGQEAAREFTAELADYVQAGRRATVLTLWKWATLTPPTRLRAPE